MKVQDLQGRGAAASASFFLGWVQNPFAVGAIAPSGRALARLMTSGLGPGSRVVELGAGTGTLTAALVERGVRQSDIVLVERNEQFAEHLRRRFPAARVVTSDAQTVATDLPELAGQVDCVVSGLPLLLFGARRKACVIEQAAQLLCDTGCVHQFTYGGLCPVSRKLLGRHGLSARRLGVAPLNVPPAFVYRWSRDDT